MLLGRLEAAGAAAEAEQGRAREAVSHSMRAVEDKIAGFQASEAARYAVSAQSGQGPEPLPAPPPAGFSAPATFLRRLPPPPAPSLPRPPATYRPQRLGHPTSYRPLPLRPSWVPGPDDAPPKRPARRGPGP